MKALTIRQPWAWLIINGGKTIENRTWNTHHRGHTLVHAAKGMTRADYDAAILFIVSQGLPPLPYDIPPFEQLERGGIIGAIDIVDCVLESDSRWFTGPYGFVLSKPEKLPFIPMRGALNFFTVESQLLRNAGAFEVIKCDCKRSDAWCCAVEQGTSTVSCHCACHRSTKSHG